MPSNTIASIFQMRRVNYRPMYPDNSLVLPNCLVGVEMELEGDTNRTVMDMDEHGAYRVAAKEDGSLRNGGVELVFSEPLLGDAAVTAIKWMFKVKEQYGLVGSIRTSTHMHINYCSDDDTADTLINTVVLWLLVEKAMCLTAGEHREYNSFCVPSYMMQPNEEAVLYNVATADPSNAFVLNDRLVALSSIDRYAAMNFSAISKYGSIECRLLGTADFDSTMQWLNILLSIKEAASSNTRDELLSFSSLTDLLNSVMPKVAGLLVVNGAAEEQFHNARSSILSMLRPASVPATSDTQATTLDSSYQNLTTANLVEVFEDDDSELTPAFPEQWHPSADEVRDLINNVLIVDEFFAANDVLGIDRPGWAGRDALRELADSPYLGTANNISHWAVRGGRRNASAISAAMGYLSAYHNFTQLPAVTAAALLVRLFAYAGSSTMAAEVLRYYPGAYSVQFHNVNI